VNRDGIATNKPTILGIIGSQRRLGNCELVVKEISKKIDIEHDLNLVRLPALNIRPCNGCYRCIDDGTCGIEDDASFLIRQIAAADAVIVAAPVYFLGAHASIKCLLDRAFSFFTAVENLAPKPCILVTTYGMKDRIGVAPQVLLTLASFLGFDVKGSVSFEAALPGDVLKSKKHRQTIERLAKGLFRPAPRRHRVRACPFCGSDIVRMRPADFICTLCHGTFHLDGSGKAVRDKKGWEVGNIEFVRSHREWLRGMKQNFLANRKEIVRLTIPYKEIGRWIEPEQK
jgi:multimeric flavodoxin WrbA